MTNFLAGIVVGALCAFGGLGIMASLFLAAIRGSAMDMLGGNG